MPRWRRGGLRTRLFLAHLLVILAGTATLFLVTFVTAPTLHDRLMVPLIGPGHTTAAPPRWPRWSRRPTRCSTEGVLDGEAAGYGVLPLAAARSTFAPTTEEGAAEEGEDAGSLARRAELADKLGLAACWRGAFLYSPF